MTRHAGWLSVLLLVTATTARADSAASPTSLYADWLHGWSQDVDLGGREAMRIDRDPETGEWSYTPAMTTTGLQISMAQTETRTQRADGGVEVIVYPGIIEYLMARRGPGGIRMQCAIPGRPVPISVDPTSDWPVK